MLAADVLTLGAGDVDWFVAELLDACADEGFAAGFMAAAEFVEVAEALTAAEAAATPASVAAADDVGVVVLDALGAVKFDEFVSALGDCI